MKFSKTGLATLSILFIFAMISHAQDVKVLETEIGSDEPLAAPGDEPEMLKKSFIHSYGDFFPELKEGFCQPYTFPQVMQVTVCQNGQLKNIQFDPTYKITLDKTLQLTKSTLNRFRKTYMIDDGDAALLKAIAIQSPKGTYLQETLNAFIIYMVDHIDPIKKNIRYVADDLDKFYAQEEERYKKSADQIRDGDSFLDAMEKLITEANVRLMLGVDVLDTNHESLPPNEQAAGGVHQGPAKSK